MLKIHRFQLYQCTNLSKDENPTQKISKFHTSFVVASNQKSLATTINQNCWKLENILETHAKNHKSSSMLRNFEVLGFVRNFLRGRSFDPFYVIISNKNVFF